VIEGAGRVIDADLEVVLTGCTAGIVGDDVGQVVGRFQAQGRPIVHVDTAGFRSSNYVSHSTVVNAILDQYVAPRTTGPRVVRPELVNVFASVPFQDPFWKGNLRELKRLLSGLGLTVNVLFGPDSGGVAEWRTVPQARFNVLVSPWYGLPIVEHLQEVYGQPFLQFPYLPIGGNETTAFLRQVATFAELPPGPVEAFIAREEATFYEELQSLATFLLEFRYGLPAYYHAIHDASYVVGLARFLLHECGIVPREQFVVDGTPAELQDGVRAALAATSPKRTIPVTFDPDAGLAQETLRPIRHPGRGLLIGSGWDKLLAREKDLDFLSAALPSPYRLVMTTGYLGYQGGLRLIEDVYNGVLATYA